MAETTYEYAISTDFPNGVVNVAKFKDEVLALELATAALVRISANAAKDVCAVVFDGDLSAGDEAALVGSVAAHDGEDPTRFEYIAPTKLVEGILSVETDGDWSDLGGTVTTLGSFVCDVSCAWGRVVGQVRTSGAGAELRVIRESDGAVMQASPVVLADSAGTWVNVQFWANQNQPSGIDCFILQGRRNGATLLEVRYFSMSLLEKIS